MIAFPLSSQHFCRLLRAHGAAVATPANHRPAARVRKNFANLLSLLHIIANIPQKIPTNSPAASSGLIFANVQMASLLKSLLSVSGDFPFAFSVACSTYFC